MVLKFYFFLHFCVVVLPLWITIEVWFALFTILAHCVVLTIITDTARDEAGGIVDSPVKMASEDKGYNNIEI
jgi:uncharacterized membrane protein